MKRRPGKSIIWLITEDETGLYVFRAIARLKKINADVKLLGGEGLSRLANELEELIENAVRKTRPGDCIIVLHDTDDSVETNRKLYQQIKRICERKRYKTHVVRLQAIQEIEAWLLADTGLCKWLGIKPKACDHLTQPSKRLEQLINKRPGSLKWINPQKPKILENMDASGDQTGRSESMRVAIEILLSLPCTQAQSA